MASTAAFVRPLANFPPSIWGDHFADYSLDNSAFERYTKGVEKGKGEVREMLLDRTINPIDKIVKLINPLHRLGVSYLFEQEIESELEKLFTTPNISVDDQEESELYNISVQFRVFRQHGYKMPCDVFKKFTDSTTGKFKETLANDVMGMLSLYEAAQLRIRGEEILDEALSFTTSHLKSVVSTLSCSLKKQVNQALGGPFHMGIPRVEARLYISTYEDDESRNELILKLAKMDFNLVQLQHQQELSHVSKWWKDSECSTKLSYARDRIVECYLWTVATYFEPQFSVGRIMLTKIIIMVSIIDDTYDAYGTLEELQLFTNASNRWDSGIIDQLPEYMKLPYSMLLNLYEEMEQEMRKEGRSYSVYHSRELMQELIRSYHLKAEWFNSGYIPSFDDYMKNALPSSTYHTLAATSFVGMGNLATEEAFEWIQKKPQIITACGICGRLQNDLVSYEFEQKREHAASSVECYVKQYGVSEEATILEFEKKVSNAWKDMNEQCLRPTEVSLHLLMRIVNLARVTHVIYRYGDGYTNVEKTKDYITTLFVDPVPC